MPRVLIAASGTGGHIYPALSLADSFPSAWQIQWLGVSNRLEIELVPEKYNLNILEVGALQGSILRKMFELFRLLFASIKVSILLRKQKINVIFTTGGYISAPSIIAAKLTGIPIVLHESNAIPGRVTRLLGRFCDQVALGIPSASRYLSGCKTTFTGTPIRSEFFLKQSLPFWVPMGKGPLILIMGGSQGAKKLNDMVRELLPWLLDEGCRIVHLTGKKDIFFHNPSNTQKHCNLVVKEFSHEISALLQHADLAISRAGASAICELMATRTPSVLIPFPQSADKHQEFNAAYMAEFGGAIIVHQHKQEENILKDVVSHLLGSNYLKEMKSNLKKYKDYYSHEKLFYLINSLI